MERTHMAESHTWYEGAEKIPSVETNTRAEKSSSSRRTDRAEASIRLAVVAAVIGFVAASYVSVKTDIAEFDEAFLVENDDLPALIKVGTPLL